MEGVQLRLKGAEMGMQRTCSRTRSFERSAGDDESGLGSGYGQRKLGLEGILEGEIDWLYLTVREMRRS